MFFIRFNIFLSPSIVFQFLSMPYVHFSLSFRNPTFHFSDKQMQSPVFDFLLKNFCLKYIYLIGMLHVSTVLFGFDLLLILIFF